MTFNQYALHTDAGCVQGPNPVQGGKQGPNGNCNTTDGCTVTEAKAGSNAAAFAAAGGGEAYVVRGRGIMNAH